MIRESPLPEPLPQVGAVLYLDTELDPSHFENGGKHWKLAGSCVLLTPDRCLTIGHILGARGEPPATLCSRYAAFFPYEGFFRFSEAPEWEDQVRGDNLALARLTQPMEHFPPLPSWRTRTSEKITGKALVCGYGSWRGSGNGLQQLEGLQQRHLVELGPPTSQPGWRLRMLDLSWSSLENGGMIAGRGNSGGPLLWPEDPRLPVIGISREGKGDQQAGSWIGNDRTRWLLGEIGEVPSASPLRAPRATACCFLEIDALQGDLIRLQVPKDTTQVRATLNASQGMRLQMGIAVSTEAQGFLESLGGDDRASGRFLSRQVDNLPEGTEEIVIGVCRVASSPYPPPGRTLAQLCVLFG